MALLDDIRTAKTNCLKLSREVPTRRCSPHGHLDTDDAAIKRTARQAYEALLKAEKELAGA
jgi:hypothetical protein